MAPMALWRRDEATTTAEKDVPAPMTRNQKTMLMCSSGVGMVGFGFVDNFVMIVAGDAIDANLGATMGISVMAAAGIGNTFSDVTGHYFGDAIERFAAVLGLQEPDLTDEQKSSKAAGSCRKHGAAIGLTIGCLLGMCPLMFTGILKRHELSEDEKALHASVFAPQGVGVEQFTAAIKAGEWKVAEKGTKIVEAGKPLDKIVLLCSGIADAVERDGTKLGTYASKDAQDPSGRNQRGDFVGGTRLLEYICDQEKKENLTKNTRLTELEVKTKKGTDKIYPNDIVATHDNVKYIEWEFGALLDVCENNNEIERAMIGIVTKELKMRARNAKLKEKESKKSMILHDYQVIVRVVLADGHVTPGEQDLVRKYEDEHGISEKHRVATLKENGWTDEDWVRGYCTSSVGLLGKVQRMFSVTR